MQGVVMTAAETRYVSDEVWNQLPQRRLPRGRTITALAAALLLLAALGLGQLAGLFGPRLSIQATQWGGRQGSQRFTEGLIFTNTGQFTTTLSTVTLTAPWLVLKKVTIDPLNTTGKRGPGNTITLKPRQTVSYLLDISVPNCAAISKAGSSVAVTGTGPLWTRTVEIRPLGTSDPNAPDSYTYTGPTDPYLIAWPLASVTLACHTAQ
jgi:uncharacterized BrkB/YihY/UPF0761 family membrane protein